MVKCSVISYKDFSLYSVEMASSKYIKFRQASVWKYLKQVWVTLYFDGPPIDCLLIVC